MLFKNHIDNIPSTKEFVFNVAYRILGLANKTYDTLYKLIDGVNQTHNKFKNRIDKILVNNRNADLEKDGTFWCKNFPITLIKVFFNGHKYSYFETFYNIIDFSLEENPNEKKSLEEFLEDI